MSVPLAVACGATALLLGLPVLTATSALEARHRAAGAADAAVLAAADAVGGWFPAAPCALAAEVAAAARADLVTCLFDSVSGDARIELAVETPFGRVVAAARAGPPEG